MINILRRYLEDINLYYYVCSNEYDYKYITGYDPTCGCVTGNDYCRCGQIHDPHFITKPGNVSVGKAILDNLSRTVRRIQSELDPKLIEYVIYNYLMLQNSQQGLAWEFDVVQGYYGEELHGIRISNFQEIAKQLCPILQGDSVGVINALLMHEYGYVLPQLSGLTHVVIEQEMIVNDLIYNNLDHFNAIKIPNKSFYPVQQLPLGIYLSYNNKRLLIDGYHRLKYAQTNKIKECSIIALS
ncbi:MAG: hypothetical protein WC942_06815 [Clostridia bacterium]|jgi:hypothetical protein